MTELVRGEASESDEEPATLSHKVFTAQEAVGEATESDEDIYEQQAHTSTSERNSSLRNKCATAEDIQDHIQGSLLKRKLIENNISIWKNYNAFIKSSFGNASKELHAADQQLMKSQLTMQSVLTTLKSTKRDLRQIQNLVSNVSTANFIPELQPWTFEVKLQPDTSNEKKSSN